MSIVSHLLMASVIFLMLGVGLRTPFGEVIDAAREFRPLLLGVLANFLVVPLLFYVAFEFLPFRPDVVIGLLVMAAVPVAPMAPPFVGMARGDVPYSIGLMTIGALLCVPLTPLILSLCLPESEAGLKLEPWRIIQTLLIAQLIPIGSGMWINHFSPGWTGKLLRVIPLIGQVGLVLSVILIVAVQARQILELGYQPILAVVLSLLGCMLIGDLMMRGESAEKRRALSISTAIRNVGLGLLIVNSNYAGTPAVAIVVVFGVLSMVVAAGYGKIAILRS